MKRKSIYSVSTILVVLICVLIFSFTLNTNANENTNKNNNREKLYTSVLIEDGDSLWSIAEEYKPDKGVSTNKYINELKIMNNMNSDTIHTGNYLTIYYYND